ncbi:hypothetical protein NUW54_g4214 [Trametes sanguinea]|uniref:Uncharacterized protein n=1 Tax=Trametes sanguinea TaxID=158606 RepID=A0ACC1PYJ5_9APHY|nr:hypothetical protein NUW54_g4214 [Trametes sanguinea]
MLPPLLPQFLAAAKKLKNRNNNAPASPQGSKYHQASAGLAEGLDHPGMSASSAVPTQQQPPTPTNLTTARENSMNGIHSPAAGHHQASAGWRRVWITPGCQLPRQCQVQYPLYLPCGSLLLRGPSLNPRPPSTATAAKPTMTIRPHADISIALSTPTGLYTPTIQAADTQSVYALAAQIKHLAHLGRQVPCALTPNEMPRKGGTVSVSNVGGIGAVESAAPVLVPGGGVAIVAIGRAKWVWDVERDPKGERRLKVGVSWSADHRVVEGAEMVAFMETWRSWVEQPQRLIADSV